jgi:hypothetical protein
MSIRRWKRVVRHAVRLGMLSEPQGRETIHHYLWLLRAIREDKKQRDSRPQLSHAVPRGSPNKSRLTNQKRKLRIV